LRARSLQQLRSAFLAGGEFAKSRRENDGGAGTALAELRDQRRHAVGRRGDDGEIGGRRQAGDICIGRDTVHGFRVRVDRIHGTGKSPAHEVAHQCGADRVRRVRRADDGNRSGPKHPVEIANGHAAFRNSNQSG